MELQLEWPLGRAERGPGGWMQGWEGWGAPFREAVERSIPVLFGLVEGETNKGRRFFFLAKGRGVAVNRSRWSICEGWRGPALNFSWDGWFGGCHMGNRLLYLALIEMVILLIWFLTTNDMGALQPAHRSGPKRSWGPMMKVLYLQTRGSDFWSNCFKLPR